MEDMSSIFMYIYTFDVLAINIATGMRTLVYDETTLSLLMGKMSERGTEEAGSYYEIVIFRLHHLSNYL